MTDVKEELEEERRKTIIYRTISKKTRKIERMTEGKIEEALKPIWNEVEFVKQGRIYGAVEVILKSEEAARENSHHPIENNEMVLNQLYMGRRMAKVRVPRIPPRVNILKVVATVLKLINERMEVIKVTQEVKRNWLGLVVNVWIQIEPNTLPDIPESLEVGSEILNILVEGRRQRCIGCGEVGHIRQDCKKEAEAVKTENEEEKKRNVNGKKQEKKKKKKTTGEIKRKAELVPYKEKDGKKEKKWTKKKGWR